MAALLFSTGGAAIKSTSMTAWQVACFRSGVAALVLFVALPQWRRFWSPRPMLVGVAYAATMILYVTANKLTTAANAIFLQSTAPMYLLLLGPLLLREKIRPRDLSYTAAMVVGVLFGVLFCYRLILPLAEDGDTVDMFMICFAFDVRGGDWSGAAGPDNAI